LRLNGIYQLLVYADYVNILGGSIHTGQKNSAALLVASKKIGLEVKTKFMGVYGDQNVGRRHKFL
jgi:hypothetical protein